MSKIISPEEMSQAIIDYPDIPMGQAVAKAQRDSSDREWWKLLEGKRVRMPNGYLPEYITFKMKRADWLAQKQKVTGEQQ